jgi:serine/threonine-protein kinase
LIGTTLAHFKIRARLGRGGMGEVYLAEDTKLDRQVALKLLPEELADDPERLKRLVREAKALAALDHPHIVTIFSVDEDHGVHFLTMAYVEGESLDSLIPEDGLPVARLLELAVPLSDALRAAHDRGIIHRDLKPSNVMVDREGRLRVLDFGLAKRDTSRVGELSQATTQGLTEQMTREGAILGSYPYMSPEQAEGRPIDARSDLFSLGVVLYEMATGRRPFQGDTGLALVTSILRDEPPALTEVKPSLPRRFEQILDRCLAKDPDERFQSAEELRDELRKLGDEVVSGTAAIGPSRFARSRGSHWGRVILLAAGALVVVLALGWVWGSRRPPPATESTEAVSHPAITSLAVLPLKNLSGDPEQDYFVDGMTEALITDLSKIGALKVISRSSAMRYKGSDESLSQIAAELGVDAVVEGAVIREGDRVGITAQLIEVETDENLWADRYERDLTSILALQGEIAKAIAAEIQVVLTPEEQTLLAATRTIDPQAHEAYLRGTFHLQQFTPRDFELALQYFETAVQIDPDYALGHTGVARVWLYRNQFGLEPPSAAIPQAQAALKRALELDDSLAEAYLVLASTTAWYEWDWEPAELAFKRAIELNPNYAEARVFYSHFLAFLGRAEASSAQIEKALELDPLNPFYQGLYGIQISMTGRLEDAIAQIRRTHEIAPGFNFGRFALAEMLDLVGRKEEAMVEIRTHYRGLGDEEILEALDRGEGETGYKGAMRAAADLLAERSLTQGGVSIQDISVLYESAGEFDQALEWLERGYESRDPDMPYIGAMPVSEELRAKPGFQDLLRRMNLPDVVSTRG